MKKLLISALALITVLTMSLTACGNNTQNPDANTDLTDEWMDDSGNGSTTGDNTNTDQNGGSTETPADTQTWTDMNDTVYVLADGVRLRSTTSDANQNNVKAVVNMTNQLSRTKVSNDGWSEVTTQNGETLYIKSAYLTTNFNDVDFVACEEKTIVLDSDIYNIYLRSAPTTAEGTNAADAVATEFNAKAVKYSEINKSGTWARIQYDGKTFYIACSLFDGIADNVQGDLG